MSIYTQLLIRIRTRNSQQDAACVREGQSMFVSKILASDLREAIFAMNGLLGTPVVELLLKTLENDGLLSEDGDAGYTFDEINDALYAIFGQATPLFVSQLEKYLIVEKN